jgi:hypothetical protein
LTLAHLGVCLVRSMASTQSNKKLIQARYDSGWKLNLVIRHLDVKVYGNAAVVTAYVDGPVTYGGTTLRGTRRETQVWIKQSGQWKRVHLHQSQLEPAPREIITQTATDGQ